MGRTCQFLPDWQPPSAFKGAQIKVPTMCLPLCPLGICNVLPYMHGLKWYDSSVLIQDCFIFKIWLQDEKDYSSVIKEIICLAPVIECVHFGTVIWVPHLVDVGAHSICTWHEHQGEAGMGCGGHEKNLLTSNQLKCQTVPPVPTAVAPTW